MQPTLNPLWVFTNQFTRLRPTRHGTGMRCPLKHIAEFNLTRSLTNTDVLSCGALWNKAKKLDGSLIEIGVWKGGTGALIARKAQLSGIVAPVYLCDTFSGAVKASEKDSSYKGG